MTSRKPTEEVKKASAKIPTSGIGPMAQIRKGIGDGLIQATSAAKITSYLDFNRLIGQGPSSAALNDSLRLRCHNQKILVQFMVAEGTTCGETDKDICKRLRNKKMLKPLFVQITGLLLLNQTDGAEGNWIIQGIIVAPGKKYHDLEIVGIYYSATRVGGFDINGENDDITEID